MIELTSRILRSLPAALALTATLWLLVDGHAQLPSGTSGSNFEYPYFDQKSRRPLLLIQGAQANMQSDGRLLVKKLRILTFEYHGSAKTTNLVATAPFCILDRRKRTVSSDGPLQVSTVDKAFSIRGESGFRFVWSQSESHLSISNQVKTELNRSFILGESNEKP